MDITIGNRKRGNTTLDVRKFGANGDGRTNDTAAFNKAISALPADGGIITVPAGTFLIDPLVRINLRSYMHLHMTQDTVLKAKTNSLQRYGILAMYNVHDVQIEGGYLLGDGDTHDYSAEGTEEWCHGIQCYGSQRITVMGVNASRCPGDGMSIGARNQQTCDDIIVVDSVMTGNHRQGISVVSGSNILIYRTECSDTKGTSPQCGIDLEPEATFGLSKVRIIDCKLRNNARYGLNSLRRAGSAPVTDVEVAGTEISGNASNGIVLDGVDGHNLHDNRIHDNYRTGTFITDVTNSTLRNNLSEANYLASGRKTVAEYSMAGTSSKNARHILVRTRLTATATVKPNAGLNIATNRYKD